MRDAAADCVTRMRGDSIRSHSIDAGRGSCRRSAPTHPTSERKRRLFANSTDSDFQGNGNNHLSLEKKKELKFYPRDKTSEAINK